ncbi:MAG: PKD domain-containing protein [Bacteroidetes bacterium]|nr:PKD domain-containing protein [Bacteroidota bacterium]
MNPLRKIFFIGLYLLPAANCLLPTAAAQVTANFSASPIAGCAPLVVQFTDMSSGGVTSWNWDLGNGNKPVIQNPSTIYSSTGVYTVTLTVSNGSSSNTLIKVNYINVYNKPAAGFTMTDDTVCIGETVTFTDATVISPGGAPIGTWAWNFGDGNNASVTVPSVTHPYTTAGNYPVSLIVTDTNGCTGNIVQNIVVVPKPSASFSATPTSKCTPPLVVSFTNTSTYTGSTTFTWYFGDGSNSASTNPSHTYTASGTYNVSLVVHQGGCTDSITLTNYITIQNIAASFVATPTVICTGQTVTFTNTSVPAAVSANWNFGDATTSATINPSHTYTAAGTYTVTMTATDASGCTGTIKNTIVVNQTPTANFIADTMVACSVPFTVNFTNTSTGGATYSWNFGDGNTSTLQNPTHTYTATGTYNVTLTVTNANGTCNATITKNAFILISPPVANFIHVPDSGCVPLTVNFTSTSSSAIDPIVIYAWNFGDGGNSALQNPVHTYTATGVYSVTLTITTQNGCTATLICNNCIKVGTPPVANFGAVPDTICFGLPINFYDSSSVPVTGWYWNFGDGGNSTLQNPTHTYADTGTYQVYLIAYNNGCSDTSAIKNVVILPPKAQFTYTLSCVNYYTVGFTSTSEGADSLVWNFGDGTIDSSNTTNPVHTYGVRGPFTVTLTAYNYSSGCNNVYTASFTIAEPIASFTVANTFGCYPFTANFTGTSQDANSVWWNFGDPSTIADTSIINNPAYTYTATGQYPVTLIITDVNGCKDTVTDTLGALGPYPYFYADTLTGCRPLLVTFIDTSVSDSVITQWIWNFGDGTIDTTYNDSIIHTYTTPGNYNVTMQITDTNGCVKSITVNNYINPTFPYPAFTLDTFACKGDILTLDASATSGVGLSYAWNFGDGNTATTTSALITHSYASDSLYVITLTVTDANGCDSTITDTVLILKPKANFGWALDTIYCGFAQYTFTDSSTGYVTNWNWNFGSAGSSTLQNPTVFYQSGGIYSVTLTITNAGLCTDTLVLDSIISVPFAAGNFSLTPTSGCNPLTVCFHSNSINTSYYYWDFGDGVTGISYGADTCHTYTVPGSWNPQLLLEYTLPTGQPCSQLATNLSGAVTVTNVINVALNEPSIIHVPQDSIVAVTTSYNGGVPPYTFNWSPSTGISCASCDNIFIVGTGDTVQYTFEVYDSAGCIGIIKLVVLSEPCFQQKLIPDVFTPNADGVNDVFYIPGVCPDENYTLQIYDRWGVLIFSTSLRNHGWDGRTNAGLEAKDGVYYYIVALANQKDKNGMPVDDSVFKGFVHLIR